MSRALQLLRIDALWREARLVFLDWAHREIDPQHPDLGHILVQRAQLRDQRSAP